jgi:hypothetical protein
LIPKDRFNILTGTKDEREARVEGEGIGNGRVYKKMRIDARSMRQTRGDRRALGQVPADDTQLLARRVYVRFAEAWMGVIVGDLLACVKRKKGKKGKKRGEQEF